MMGPLILDVDFSWEVVGAIIREKKPVRREPCSLSFDVLEDIFEVEGESTVLADCVDTVERGRSGAFGRSSGVGRILG